MKNEPFVSERALNEKVRKFKMPSKKMIYTVAGLLVFGAAIFSFKSYFVVAMVNGNFVSKSSLVEEMEKVAGKQALETLIVNKLIEESVKDVKVSDAEIAEKIKKTKDQLVVEG